MTRKLILLTALALVVHPGLDWLVDHQFAKARGEAVAVRGQHAR